MKKIIKEAPAVRALHPSERRGNRIHEGKERAVQGRADRGSSGRCRASASISRASLQTSAQDRTS